MFSWFLSPRSDDSLADDYILRPDEVMVIRSVFVSEQTQFGNSCTHTIIFSEEKVQLKEGFELIRRM